MWQLADVDLARGGHGFEVWCDGETPHADAGAGEPLKASATSEGSRAEKKPRAARRPQSEKSAERPAAADKALAKHPAVKSSEPGPPAGPKVVSIDAFRKK